VPVSIITIDRKPFPAGGIDVIEQPERHVRLVFFGQRVQHVLILDFLIGKFRKKPVSDLLWRIDGRQIFNSDVH